MEDKQIIAAYSKTLKKLRIEKSISQEKLAFKAGLHPTYISLLETGKRQPSLSVIFRIAKELGYLPNEFVKKIEEAA
ncbi:Helix-turn-helix [Reichenbachiella faecimaris]|uniref:Helix-turn-helix n=1 Tax=Reichenbachiella faecimaris TaxID=692418 RepID=A0A1W2G552_REIFA|nr:helix-turn-helix transcriptional regulator [Reichenbachiella faecimaris]SMD31800.1 Helix-turn-helix [Reichenbachiella faecimaris]